MSFGPKVLSNLGLLLNLPLSNQNVVWPRKSSMLVLIGWAVVYRQNFEFLKMLGRQYLTCLVAGANLVSVLSWAGILFLQAVIGPSGWRSSRINFSNSPGQFSCRNFFEILGGLLGFFHMGHFHFGTRCIHFLVFQILWPHSGL